MVNEQREAMSKSSQGRFFEDFRIDEDIIHPVPRTLSEADSALYLALTGSRFSLFCSRPFARSLGFADIPMDNLLVFHIAFGRTVADISRNAIANLGYAEVRFEYPVYAGDTIDVSSRVIGLRETRNGKAGIVTVASRACGAEGRTLLSWKRWLLMAKREPGQRTDVNIEAQLAPQVEAQKLPLPTGQSFADFDRDASGEPWSYEDYQPGEIIDHVDGVTLDEAEHMMATRLYQNNARVHFNAHRMANSDHGRRLVYGGHVMSLCRALSHNGLANGQWLAAINGGSHANPVHAGDTLYARSEVLDKFEWPDRQDLGALRLRTFGYKNCAWPDMKEAVTDNQGRRLYHPNLVLDLDYTVLFPRR